MGSLVAASKSPERKHRKIELLKLMAARSDISGAKHAAEMLLQHAPEIGRDLNYPLVVAAVVCYSRPFTDNKPHGMLPTRYVRSLKEELRALHGEITTARDEFFAHSDLTKRAAYIFPPDALIAKGPTELRSSNIGSALQTRLYTPAFFTAFVEACNCMLVELKVDIDALLQELYGDMELPKAKFRLRIDNGL